jgi:hypothetical protein
VAQRARVWLVLLLSVSGSGCGGSSPNTPTPSTTAIALPTPDKTGQRGPLPPGQGPVGLSGAWSGSVAATAVVEFGGPPYCYYTVQLTNIASSVQVNAGTVSAARVTALHTEQAIRGCPYAPLAPQTHTYTLNSATVTDHHVAIRYDAAPANAPTAALDFVGDISADGHSIAGTFTWQRVDQASAPNLEWRVTADMTMAAAP